MEFIYFFFWVFPCVHQFWQYLIFISIDAEVETGKDIEHLWELRTLFCALERLWEMSSVLCGLGDLKHCHHLTLSST